MLLHMSNALASAYCDWARWLLAFLRGNLAVVVVERLR